MNRKKILRQLPLIFFVLSLMMFVLSMASGTSDDLEKTAFKTEQHLADRMEILDRHIETVLNTEQGRWPDIDKLPDDMVIYRYVNDSLQSWSNQFSVLNDDISQRMVFQRMSSLTDRVISPLSKVTESPSFTNIGSKWYVTKAAYGKNNDKVIAGLEVKNTLIDDVRKNDNGVNRALNLPARFSVLTINNTGGAEVCYEGIPLFKIITETTLAASHFDNSALKWIAMMLFGLATVLLLASHRTIKAFIAVSIILWTLLITACIWAQRMNESINFFSPTVYADGPMTSLGVLIIINAFLSTSFICGYMVRNRIMAYARYDRKHRDLKLKTYAILKSLTAIASFIYTHITLKSLIMNSNITMELYRWNSNIAYTVIVYLSYTALLFCTLLLFQSIRSVVKRYTGIRYNILSKWGIVCFAFLCSLYFTMTFATLGFRKEQDRVSVWANRLAVDRNLSLEIQLRSVEENIANDQLISALSTMDNTGAVIHNRISEYYLNRIRQDNTIDIRIVRETDKEGLEYFDNILRSGTPISQGSRFFFLTDGNGRSSYAGTFFFWTKEHGLNRLIILVEPNSNREDRGYHSIIGKFSKPGEINIPSFYSYAKYIDDRLISYKGTYPYPTVSFQPAKTNVQMYETLSFRTKEHVHFISQISDNEIIVITRKQRNPAAYLTSFSYLFLVICALLTMFVKGENKNKAFKSNYYRKRINTILLTSSFLILLTMSIISVLFVYKRNEANMYDLMSNKINTVQALTETRVRQADDWQFLRTPEIVASLENIANTTKSDITLYTPEGKVFHSTTPEIFEKQILGSRINEEAYKNIRYMNQRFFIHREKIADYSYWMLYAPIFNDDREIISIISTPYTEQSYNFRREAFSHAALIINLFLLLLICSLLYSTREVNQMFAPLIEMGRKMNKADIHNPEYIIYKREDEISSLVDAYNRMLEDLSESTRKLASAERDKAWSEMARQVAHEIKNPLTPIKLEIQRLIRLKQNGNPAWEEKFDKVSSVVLEHIDILTDTANEFSTFAKLYSEEPVLLDLDKTLKEQLLIFDNKDNIRISYIGLTDAFVMAPKPQLIRVFVNLITNAIQAVEIHQREALETEGKVIQGNVVICLRNSTRDGYYDIVFDDNGPGVKEENLKKLFTPNFTTKSAGTGLGLAICRNIINKCNGEISYRKSYALGGASFVVTLPKLEHKP